MPRFTNHADDEECQRLRQLAENSFQQRAVLSNHGSLALARGKTKKGNKLMELADEKYHEANHYNRMAAEYVFGANNPRGISQKIDFHGLHVKEAECYCKQCIFEHIKRHHPDLYVIVGTGSHSPGGFCRLSRCVEQLCEKASLTYRKSKHNPAAIMIDAYGARVPSSRGEEIETLFSLNDCEKVKLIVFLARILFFHCKHKQLK